MRIFSLGLKNNTQTLSVSRSVILRQDTESEIARDDQRDEKPIGGLAKTGESAPGLKRVLFIFVFQ